LPSSPEPSNRWNGIFDPSSAGIWLLGTDARNEAGLSYRGRKIVDQPSLDPEKLEFRMTTENNLECRTSKGDWIPLWCLHLHSKEPKYFDFDGLVTALKKSLDGDLRTRFSPVRLLLWIREVIRDVISWRGVKRAATRLSQLFTAR